MKAGAGKLLGYIFQNMASGAGKKRQAQRLATAPGGGVRN